MKKPEQIIAAWFLVQATAVALWWGLLSLMPSAIELFHPKDWPSESLFAFGIADSILLVLGSVVAAIAVHRGTAWAPLVVWCVAAAAWYPTLYCLGASVITDQAWIATSAMVAMAGISLVMATMTGSLQFAPAVIRAVNILPKAALLWTACQTVIFWRVFLWILPKGIVELESAVGIGAFDFPLQFTVAAFMFACASVLGLSSGITMAMLGNGTPLPTATASQLVVAGPYRWVRNPMAVAGIAQGIAVGIGMGSAAVIVYALCGAALWHNVARPVEEADLVARFGESYESYRDRTGLWLPRFGK